MEVTRNHFEIKMFVHSNKTSRKKISNICLSETAYQHKGTRKKCKKTTQAARIQWLHLNFINSGLLNSQHDRLFHLCLPISDGTDKITQALIVACVQTSPGIFGGGWGCRAFLEILTLFFRPDHWAQCTRNGNDRSPKVVVLISGAFVRSWLIPNGVYTLVTDFHIAVPTITCSLRYAQSTSNKMSPYLFFSMNPLGAYFINQSHDP